MSGWARKADRFVIASPKMKYPSPCGGITFIEKKKIDGFGRVVSQFEFPLSAYSVEKLENLQSRFFRYH